MLVGNLLEFCKGGCFFIVSVFNCLLKEYIVSCLNVACLFFQAGTEFFQVGSVSADFSLEVLGSLACCNCRFLDFVIKGSNLLAQ